MLHARTLEFRWQDRGLVLLTRRADRSHFKWQPCPESQKLFETMRGVVCGNSLVDCSRFPCGPVSSSVPLHTLAVY